MEHFKTLEEKVKNNVASDEERMEYHQAILSGKHDEEILAEVKKTWDTPHPSNPDDLKILDGIFHKVKANQQHKVRPLYFRPTWIAAAAATLFMFVIAGFWLYQRTTDVATVVTAATHTVAGPDYITLPDRSTVELRAGSTLAYSDDFGTKDRTVKLSGTAFFDVTRNTELPFKVVSGKVVTTVLGTAFNVSEDAKFVEVTVVRGKVSVGDHKAVFQLIEPNEKIVVDTKHMGFAIRRTSTVPELAWKANNIIFDGTPMNEVIAKLEQRFKVDIEIANDALNSCEVNVWFTKGNETLSDILTPICVLHDAQLVRKGNRIVIEGGKGCGNK